MIHNSITDCIGGTPLVRLGRLFPQDGIEVLAKLEMLNPGGSVKDRSARYIVERGIRDGMIRRGTRIVESTSGNFGVALAMVAVRYGLRFTAVVDPNASRTNLRILRQYGAEIEMVSEPDHAGGYLHTRLARVQDLLADDSDAVWINQYANELNWETHAVTTAREVIQDCPEPVDVLVAAVSTTGTLHGLARGLRREWPGLKVVAVDAVGSVIFGTPPGPRMLPGVGSSRVPELFTPGEIDQVVHIDDAAAIHGCHRLLRHEAIFAGGSSGSVVAAIEELLPELPRPSRILTLLADRGERYLDLVYTDEMAIEHDELVYSSHS